MFCIDNMLSGCASLKWKCSHLYTLEYFILFSQVTYTWLSLSFSLSLTGEQQWYSLTQAKNRMNRRTRSRVCNMLSLFACRHNSPIFFPLKLRIFAKEFENKLNLMYLAFAFAFALSAFCLSFSLIYPFAFCFNFWPVSALRSFFRPFTLCLLSSSFAHSHWHLLFFVCVRLVTLQYYNIAILWIIDGDAEQYNIFGLPVDKQQIPFILSNKHIRINEADTITHTYTYARTLARIRTHQIHSK